MTKTATQSGRSPTTTSPSTPVKSSTRSMMGSDTLPTQLTVWVARATQPSRKSVMAATV